MPDTFAITILFIVVSTLIGAFIKGRSKDRCLKSFSRFPVTLEKKDGKIVWGDLRAENSGLELVYSEPYLDKEDNHTETSYILFKSEYDGIFALIRYVDSLTQKLNRRRSKELAKAHNPGIFSRYGRRIRNIFGTVRDSLMEAANLFMGRVKTITPVGKVLQGQDKYVSGMQQQMFQAAGTSYEPILEKYIGKKVVLALIREGKKEEYSGVLKDYTTDFIEIMDINYKCAGSGEPRKADAVVPRTVGIVRHSGGR